MTDFMLHPRLAADTLLVAEWPLSRVVLMNDSRFPWLILVPRVAGASEMFDLEPRQQAVLMDEISRASRTLKRVSGAAKINVGALGNMVPQLHVHVVARNPSDAAWPGPVWGAGQAVPYAFAAADALIARLAAEFQS